MHQWSMQAIDGKYADPSMRLVFFSTETTGKEAIYANEIAAEFLIEGDSCPIIEVGDTILGIKATGSCNELHVGNDPDSIYLVDTTGITSLVVFAKHGPIEFENNRHYFQNSVSVDIEPVVQESGGGGDGHDHGHGHDHAHYHDHMHGHDHAHYHEHTHEEVDEGGSYVDSYDYGHEHDHGHGHHGVDSGASDIGTVTATTIAVFVGFIRLVC